MCLTTKSVDQVSNSRSRMVRSTNHEVSPSNEGYARAVQIGGTWSKNRAFSSTSISLVMVSSPLMMETVITKTPQMHKLSYFEAKIKFFETSLHFAS